jgi:aspartyl-tRNA(Asn)/glutamyl-tRNA(Gln) amidotransferase subunit B
MYDFPLCQHGWIDVENSQGKSRRIGITRVHLEEDTAKLFHRSDHSLVDFNRAGLPLIEIVTEPDIGSPEEARQYLIKLRAILRTLGVSTGDMEKGAMRCEANVSLRPFGAASGGDGELGTKVEVKNLNSTRAVKKALAYEIARQTRLLDTGDAVRQVTMGWDETRGRTVEQRVKEEADDYRYFPEPDLPPLRVSRAWVARLAADMPELPDAKRERFAVEYGLRRSEAAVLAAEREVARYFEAAVVSCREEGVPARVVGNWVTGDLFHLLGTHGVEIGDARVSPEGLARLIVMVETGTISANSGRAVLEEMFESGQSAEEVVERRGLEQISDPEALAVVVDEVLAANPEQVYQYRTGKEKLLSWFVGQVMRTTGGKANPQGVIALLRERL